jgi:hypothetical protein
LMESERITCHKSGGTDSIQEAKSLTVIARLAKA